jgi:hypothetical protein
LLNSGHDDVCSPNCSVHGLMLILRVVPARVPSPPTGNPGGRPSGGWHVRPAGSLGGTCAGWPAQTPERPCAPAAGSRGGLGAVAKRSASSRIMSTSYCVLNLNEKACGWFESFQLVREHRMSWSTCILEQTSVITAWLVTLLTCEARHQCVWCQY